MFDPIYWKALVLGIVEGLTEFLPISSTGHLILAGDLLNFNDEKGKIFELVIQTGAMLAVVWEYRHKFAAVLRGLVSDPGAQRFVANLVIAFMPAALLGLAFGKHIKVALFKPCRWPSPSSWVRSSSCGRSGASTRSRWSRWTT